MATLHESSEELPFEVNVETYWGDISESRGNETIKLFTENKEEISALGLNIVEYINFKISFKANIDNCFLKIDNSIYDQEDIILFPGDKKDLSNNKFHWVPDDYLLEVSIGRKKYYSCLKVDAKNVNTQQLKKMRTAVNDLLYGVIFNISNKKSSGNILLKQMEFVESDIHLLNYIKRNITEILNTLDDIVKNPILDLRKKYKIRNDKFRLDKKGIKWLEGNKARSVNNSIHNPNFLYQKNLEYSLNNIENKWMIKCIDYIRRRMNFIKKKLEQGLEVYIENIRKLKNDKLKYEERLNKLKNITGTSIDTGTEIKQRTGQIYGTNNKIEEYKRKVEIIREHLLTANSLLKHLSLIFEKELYEYNKNYLKVAKPGNRLFKDRRYKMLYNFYQELTLKPSENHLSENNNNQYKRTDKIYEYYILINIIKCLTELDYEWEEDLIKKKIADHLILDIPEGLCLVFKQDLRTVKVYYEKEIDKYSDEELSKNNIEFFSNRNNLQPDFRIDVYDNNDYIKSFIIEVKYQRYRNLYNSQADTDVVVQLNNYIDYIKRYPDFKSVISNVLVAYPQDPGNREVIDEKKNGVLIFAQLSPDYDGKDHYGYQEFKDKMKELLGRGN
ncbi:MAG: hypothetical protein ACOCRK_06080 [bacterium]